MQDNPYMAMLDGIKQRAQSRTFSPVRTGVMVGVSPLAVNTGGIMLSGTDLLVNFNLLPRIRQLRLTEADGVIDGDASGAANGTLIIALEETDILCTAVEQNGSLSVGDRVVLLTEDNNLFVIACKVVGA